MRLALVPAAVCVVVLSAPALAGTAAVPDIETFMQIGYCADPAVTRDGARVYFQSGMSGVSQVYRRDAEGWPYQLTVFSEGVTFYSLSPDGKHIVCGVAAGGNENAQLWLVDALTGAARALTDAPEVRHGGPSWTPDGAAVFFNSNQGNGKDFHVYRMEIPAGTVSPVLAMEGWNSPGDVSDDGRRLLVTHYASNTDSDVYLVDLEGRRGSRRGGSPVLLTAHEGDVQNANARFSADGSRVYLVSNGNPDGVSRRAVIDVAARTLRFLDTEGPWEVEAMELSPARDVMGWTVNEDGYLRLRLWDLVRDRALPAPPLDGQVSGFAFTNRGSAALAFSSAASTTDIWIWDWRAPELVKVSHSTYAGIDPSLFSEPELVRYPSFDGLLIPAFLYLPPSYRPGTPIPFVVHMHGGPESQFRPAFIRHFQYLLLHGYGVLAPNVRGSSGYGRDYMDMDNYTKRLDSVKDLKAGTDYLIAHGYSAPGMLAIKGGSYGGYMTLAAITEYPSLFSAAVDEVGIANFVSFLENTAEYRRYLREAEYGPLSDRAFLESISPLNKADRITTPLLVIHGENDPRVPVGEARQIIAALDARGVVVDSLIFPDEGHGASKRPNVIATYRRTVAFLDANLKGARGGADPAP
jgi:dipeptidyl aminopeptidase/acylaminoacyl peptidase